jgi:membrane-bound lytic murein transglycosylase D
MSGCAPVQNQALRNSFLPPSHPLAETRLILADPPKIETQEFFSRETPELILSVPRRLSGADLRIQQADEHYAAGRKAYLAGDLDAARAEFDRAVDILMSAPETMTDRAKVDRKLERMIDSIYRYDVDGMGAGDTGGEVVYDKSPLDGILDLTFPIDPKLKPRVQEELAATQSQLPLDQKDAVLSYIHFFSTDRGRRILESGLQRAGRYRAMIERVLHEEGLPEELLYLAQAESGFLPRAVSYKKATGMWQFGSSRGKEYGLERTAYSDDRLDPEKATRAAARHLRDLYQHFGDWYLAMAAYNCGPGCVDHAIERTGYADFWKLSSLKVLPQETQNYVPLILAMTIMAKNPADYGLDVDADAPIQYDNVTLTAPTSLNLIADACQCSVAEIHDLNPALLKNTAPEGYRVHLPKGSRDATVAALNRVPASHRGIWRLHRVEPGDTLPLLARRYKAVAGSIATTNSLDSDLEEGSLLVIPVAPAPARRATKRHTSSKTRGTAQRNTTTHRTSVRRSAPRKSSPARAHTATAKRTPVKSSGKADPSYKTASLR